MDFFEIFQMRFTNPFQVVWELFMRGGWVLVVLGLLKVFWDVRLSAAQDRYSDAIEHVLLAIDIPPLSERTIKASENIFSQLAGIQSKGNLVDRLWKGKNQESFSLEIIVRGGRVQFCVRTPKPFQALAESAIYAHYPDAQIAAVEDYIDSAPKRFPHQHYDLWGTEFVLAKPNAYPIRTYMNFEHTMSKKFADPLAAVVETLSRFRKSEEGWLQFVITPIDQDWQEESTKTVKKLIGEKIKEKPSLVGALSAPVGKEAIFAMSQLLGGGEEGAGKPVNKESKDKNQLQYLTQGEQDIVSGIQEKAAKIGFRVKFRYVYFAKKEDFDKAKGVAGVIGSLLQFNTLNMNAFKPGKRTKVMADYFFVNSRIATKQNKILRAFMERDKDAGEGDGFILNIEELASVFHFPTLDNAHNLSLARVEAKTGEAPAALPVESDVSEGEETAVMPMSSANGQTESAVLPTGTLEQAIIQPMPTAETATTPTVATLPTIEERVTATSAEGPGVAPANLPVE